MALNYYPGFDYPEWEILGIPAQGTAVSTNLANGTWIAEDYRNNDYAHPLFYWSNANSNLKYFNHKLAAWQEISTATGIGGTFGQGGTSVFVPSLSPSGTLATGNTTTTVVLSTALPASVLANQLANRGDGLGFIIRITGKSGGGSGKTEERRVIANTSGTTPTIELDSALTFTPASGDGYEFLSGSYVQLNTGALTANQFRRYDCLTGSFSSLSTTNLIATVPATGNILVAFDPGYVPNDRKSGEGQVVGAGTYDGGKFGCLTATASSATSITGETSIGDYGFPANTFRNYQIRIVEDTGTPTAVGQVGRITSHTAPGGGAGNVYTVPTWGVTPSATAKFVIEHFGNNIMGLMGGTTVVYNYSISGNVWDTTTWAARSSSAQSTAAYAALTSGVSPNKIGTKKSSNVFCFRGATNVVDVMDISGAATGSWTNAVTLLDSVTSALDAFTANDLIHFAYNPHTQDGKYIYYCPGSATNTAAANRNFARIDTTNFKVQKFAGMKAVSGSFTPAGCNASFISLAYKGTDKVAFYVTPKPLLASGTPEFWRCPLTF